MKLALNLLALMLLLPSSYAAWNELECEEINQDREIRLEIEQPFPYNSYFRRAQLTVVESGSHRTHQFTVTPRINPQFGRIDYWGAGMRLEVNIWPDRSPRWGWRYPSRFESAVVDNWSLNNLNCTFPNAL